MPRVIKRSLGIVLAACLAFAGALLLPANADASVHGASVAPVAAQVSTTGLALSGDEDPLALCNAPADSSTPGEGGYTAPAPMKLDASGTDQDAICIPDDFDHPSYSWGGYYRDGNNITVGFNKVNGATSVTITSSYHSGTWTFDFPPDDQPGEEAENKYWVEVGDTCIPGTAGVVYRKATAYFKNEDDVTHRLVHSIYPHTEREDRTAFASADTVYDIADGVTVDMPIMEQTVEILGLTPGNWVTTFYRSDTGSAGSGGYVVKTVHYTVPKCGGNTGGTSQRARGKLSRVGCRAVRVTADTRGFTAAPSVTYRVVRKAYGKVGHARTMVVPEGKRYVKYLRHFGHRWSRVTLLVQRTDGHWAVISRLRMYRCHR